MFSFIDRSLFGVARQNVSIHTKLVRQALGFKRVLKANTVTAFGNHPNKRAATPATFTVHINNVIAYFTVSGY